MPALANNGLPSIGNTFAVDLSKAPGSRAAAFFLGVSDRTWGAFRLPLDLGALAPGCKLLVSGDVMVSLVTSARGRASVPLPVPNNLALLKQKLFQQFLVVDRAANPLGLIFSNGGRATIGDG